MSNKLLKQLTKDLKADNNLEAIRAYIIADDDSIQLTDEQARQKLIIDFTDEQLRAKAGVLNRYNIAQVISNRFSITHRSAQKYITMAEDLYSSSNPLNKKYKIQLRIERCEELQRICIEKDELLVAASFEKLIQEYIKQYPEMKITRSKRIQTFVLPGQVVHDTMTIEQAVAELSPSTQSNGGE